MEKIYESEYRFLCVLWENEPITSPKLVQLCNEKLGWKKSTTYTVIKKLTDKGIVTTFLAAFLKDRKLTKAEAQRIRKLIDDMEEDE